jgi:hypothetical protein
LIKIYQTLANTAGDTFAVTGTKTTGSPNKILLDAILRDAAGTALGTTPSPVIAALQGIQLGTPVTVSPFGAIKTAEMNRLIGGSLYTSPLLSTFWTTTLAAGGTAPVANGELELRTNVTANGSAIVQTAKRARFISASSNVFLGGIRLGDTGAANNVRRWGAFDPTNGTGNGFFFELSGTAIRVVTRKAGVDTVVSLASFNGGNAFVLDTNHRLYEILYSTEAAYFFQDQKLIHTATYPTGSPIAVMDLRLGYQNTNSGGGTADARMFCRSSSISRLGPPIARPIFRHTNVAETVTLKNSPGNLHKLIVNFAGVAGASVTVYDNTAASGVIIASVDFTGVTPATLEYDIDFDIGLTFVAVGTGFSATLVFD